MKILSDARNQKITNLLHKETNKKKYSTIKTNNKGSKTMKNLNTLSYYTVQNRIPKDNNTLNVLNKGNSKMSLNSLQIGDFLESECKFSNDNKNKFTISKSDANDLEKLNEILSSKFDKKQNNE